MYWSLKSCIFRNFSWYSILRFIWAFALLCQTFELLVLPVHTIAFGRPIESSDISRFTYSMLASTWFLLSESHSDISTEGKLHKLPLITLSVFISSPMQYSYTLFLCKLRNLWFDNLFLHQTHFHVGSLLNCVLTYRTNLLMAFRYSSRLFLPTENPTPLKRSSAVDCCFLPLFLPPFFLKPWNLLPHCSLASLSVSDCSFIVIDNF